MDSLYAWLHRTSAYGVFLRHCLWTSQPAHWSGGLRQLAVLRILGVALCWGVLPVACVLGPLWLGMALAGVEHENRALVLGAAGLAVALGFAPIILRTLLMPLAWLPAMTSSMLGPNGPAIRVYDEMQKQYDEWRETYG